MCLPKAWGLNGSTRVPLSVSVSIRVVTRAGGAVFCMVGIGFGEYYTIVTTRKSMK